MTREKKLRSLGDGSLHSVRVERTDEEFRVSGPEPGGAITSVSRAFPGGVWSILTARGESYEATVERHDGELDVAVGHARFRFRSGEDDEALPRAALASRVEVKAPMPGKVVAVLVAAGEAVRAGHALVLFEAMKMQNEIRSPQDGVVVELAVAPGQAVEARERLLVLNPPNSR